MIEDRLYTASEVSVIADVNMDMLRRWHRDRIAQASHQTHGGHRRYTMRDVRRVVIVAALRASKHVVYRELGSTARELEGRDALWS